MTWSGVVSSLSSILPTSQVFTSGYVNMETILHFFYKITNERGTKTVFTYTHVKWFYGQSEYAYYLHYFIILFVVYFARLARNFATSATSLSALKKSCTVRSELKFYWLFLIDYGVSLYINFALAFQLSIPSTAHRKLTLSIYHQILTSNNVVCSSSYKEENIYKSNMLL